MGNDADQYCCVDGAASFLAGAADALIGNLSIYVNQSGIHYEDVQGDVFYIGEQNEIAFNDAIQTRMRAYWNGSQASGGSCVSCKDKKHEEYEEHIHKLDLKFDPLNVSPEAGILNMYEEYGIANRELLMKRIDSFCKEIGYYLGKARSVYYATKESLLTADAIVDCYTYIVMGIIVIEFDTYILMLVRGSNE